MYYRGMSHLRRVQLRRSVKTIRWLFIENFGKQYSSLRDIFKNCLFTNIKFKRTYEYVLIKPFLYTFIKLTLLLNLHLLNYSYGRFFLSAPGKLLELLSSILFSKIKLQFEWNYSLNEAREKVNRKKRGCGKLRKTKDRIKKN